MITSVAEFIRYFEGVRRRTWVAVDRVTPALLGWKPRPDEFTCGDIIRHLAGAERFFVTKVIEDRWTADLDGGPALDLEKTRAALTHAHADAMERLRDAPDARLSEQIVDLDGGSMRVWRFLMAMVEHEVHHRSQLDSYLAEAGTEPPQLYGRKMEDVIAQVRRS